MNVVQRDKNKNSKLLPKCKNELVRRDATSVGIRGPTSLLPSLNLANIRGTVSKQTPRYKFSNEESSTSKMSTMGPPLGLPRSLKRKIITNSSSSKPESSTSSRARPRVLASDSAVADTSQDFHTPRNRPTALRYISSSSRGGYSGNRSARSTSTSAVDASVILAISEGRGMARGEIGIAAVDLRHPHLVLCQFSDTLLYTHTLTKINYFNPVEIIVPHTFCEGVKPNQLYQLIKDNYPLLNLTTVQRRHFNDAAGRQQIQTLCAPEYSRVYLQVLHKFYALTAAAAVLKYVEYIQCIVFARESLKIEYHSSENTMIIDVGTAIQLELVQPLVPSAGPTCCLLGVLGPTYTIGGIRALRASILQPSCNKEFLENRLDAIQDLIENESGLMVDLQDVIKKLSDIDKILLLCVETTKQSADKGEAQLNQTLLLKTTMDVVPKLVEALSTAESGRLRKIKMDFENPHYKEIADRIRNIIQDDAHLEKGSMGSLQRCFAVKPEINGLLDVARRTYSELIEDIQKIVEQLSENYDLPIRLNQNVMKGFHIVMAVAPKNRRHFNVEELPPIFIQVHYNGASVTMSTEELVVLDHQAKESLNEIQKMSNIVIESLLKDLRPFMSSLYKLCENVAELDILLALAQASSVNSYIRPDFNSYMDVRNSVHPLLDYNSQLLPVPNDIFASPEYNFTLITGPNMGGKSIYIKQVAIMQVMAQIGCFLPATNAVLRLCDRLFSRIGFNDSVELNASTFVYEMKEMQHIIKGVTSSSLVIIDELCRGTTTEEGTSMAWAICEELILSDAFTFFTTHFMYLTKLQELYPNVQNRHTAVAEQEITNTENPEKRIIYQHKIEDGTTKIIHYGLALAANTNLPEDTVKLARELAELIDLNTMPQEIRTPTINDEILLYNLNADIRKESRRNANDEEIIRQMMNKFKRDNKDLIQKIQLQRMTNTRTDSSANYSSNPESRSKVYELPTETSAIIENSLTPQIVGMHRHNNNISSKRAQVTEKINVEENYATVKSSTELLISVLCHNNKTVENTTKRKPNDTEINKNTDEHIVDTNEDIHQNRILNTDNEKDKTKDSSKDFLETVAMNINNTMNEISSDDDSERADALTQVIDEVSLLENSGSTDSTDEQLMAETINEISSGTADVDSIILTPPFSFRDV